MPHRLDRDERLLFDQARRRGFLEISGSGWRSQRRDAPLLNTYRSLCDARGRASIVLHKGRTGMDEIVVDLSPLRLPETFAAVAGACADFTGLLPAVAGTSAREDDASGEAGEGEKALEVDQGGEDPWDERPIYHLSPYLVSWELQRSDAKALGKKLAVMFNTAEKKAPTSRKPKNVKPGKGRRSGGYGIG